MSPPVHPTSTTSAAATPTPTAAAVTSVPSVSVSVAADAGVKRRPLSTLEALSLEHTLHPASGSGRRGTECLNLIMQERRSSGGGANFVGHSNVHRLACIACVLLWTAAAAAAAAAASTANGPHVWGKKPTGSTMTGSTACATGTATAAAAATVPDSTLAMVAGPAAVAVTAAARPTLIVPPTLPPWLDLPLLSQHVLTGTLSRFCRAAVGQQQVCVCVCVCVRICAACSEYLSLCVRTCACR
jgi:hypothetical protein